MTEVSTKSVAVIFGTRPEAIKLAPLIKELRLTTEIRTLVVATGQHKELLDQALKTLGLKPDVNLSVLTQGQTLGDMSARVLRGLTEIFLEQRPDYVLVHGDTSSSFAASIAAFYLGIPVGHVEAGLRSGNRVRPFPEEFNRRAITLAASYHFAPTKLNAENLISEGIDPSRIAVTGNTVVDALSSMSERFGESSYRERIWSRVCNLVGQNLEGRRIVLITGHRRENQERSLGELALALSKLASEFKEIAFVYPLHPSPAVREAVRTNLGSPTNLIITEPLDYETFLFLLSSADLAITDSGGLQEEAPSFGVPLILVRDETERPEAVDFGLTELVAGDSLSIYSAARKYLDSSSPGSRSVQTGNPFGDGSASKRIVSRLISILNEA